MGPKPSKIDFGAINRNHEEALAKLQKEFNDRQTRDYAQHLELIETMKISSAKEREKMETEFQARQAELTRQNEAEQERSEKRIAELVQSVTDAEQHIEKLVTELKQPIVDRQAKVDFVNGLGLTITQSQKLLLVGPKGMGKSTFMWLLNQGEKPQPTQRDGTVEILQLQKFVDSIGLTGWSTEELLKLLVLMIYDGIPKDLIIFGNDRIDLPLTNLGLLGIRDPMIVIMFSDFWTKYEPRRGGAQKVHLKQDSNGVRKVQPVENLELMYNMDVYDDIREYGRGTPITHHDNIDALVRNRGEIAGIHPFQALIDILGGLFTVKATENDHRVEMLFRLIYIYEKKYCKNRLAFMNSASLQDFAFLA